MDTLRALIGGANGGTVTAAAALPEAVAPQADARAVITDIAQNEALAPVERAALVDAAMAIDQFIASQPDRAGNLDQVVGLGVYLSKTSATTWPRWNVMTALRAYGLNLKEQPSQPAPTEAQAAQQVQARLEGVARGSRQVSLDTALAVARAPTAPVIQHVAATVAPKAVTTPAPAPAPTPAAHAAPTHVDAVV